MKARRANDKLILSLSLRHNQISLVSEGMRYFARFDALADRLVSLSLQGALLGQLISTAHRKLPLTQQRHVLSPSLFPRQSGADAHSCSVRRPRRASRPRSRTACISSPPDPLQWPTLPRRTRSAALPRAQNRRLRPIRQSLRGHRPTSLSCRRTLTSYLHSTSTTFISSTPLSLSPLNPTRSASCR